MTHPTIRLDKQSLLLFREKPVLTRLHIHNEILLWEQKIDKIIGNMILIFNFLRLPVKNLIDAKDIDATHVNGMNLRFLWKRLSILRLPIRIDNIFWLKVIPQNEQQTRSLFRSKHMKCRISGAADGIIRNKIRIIML